MNGLLRLTMFRGKVSFKLPKLTLEQKALKRAIRPLAKDIKNSIKNEVPKRSGALKFSVDFKIISRKGNAAAIIGVKSHYQKLVKGRVVTPNLYALKVGVKEIIKSYVNLSTVTALNDSVKTEVERMLK
jgi:hypothetical protein